MSRNWELLQEMDGSLLGNWIHRTETVSGRLGKSQAGAVSGDAALELVQRIFLQGPEVRPQVVVMTGIDHGNGCSRVAASVAEALGVNARGGVCLVEGNFRSPGLSAFYGTTNHRGLTEALLQEVPIRSLVRPVSEDRVFLLSSGSLASDSPGLLNSGRLKARFAELRAEFEFVVVDAPPFGHYSDAIALGKLSDGIVLVLEAESTRREAALSAVENIRSSQIEILGAVLNKRIFPIPEKIYRRL